MYLLFGWCVESVNAIYRWAGGGILRQEKHLLIRRFKHSMNKLKWEATVCYSVCTRVLQQAARVGPDFRLDSATTNNRVICLFCFILVAIVWLYPPPVTVFILLTELVLLLCNGLWLSWRCTLTSFDLKYKNRLQGSVCWRANITFNWMFHEFNINIKSPAQKQVSEVFFGLLLIQVPCGVFL